MKLPKWSIPFALRVLSLAGLASAAGGDKALAVGFGVGFTLSAPNSTESLAQPRPADLSLDVDFLVQVQNHELRIPIMPL